MAAPPAHDVPTTALTDVTDCVTDECLLAMDDLRQPSFASKGAWNGQDLHSDAWTWHVEQKHFKQKRTAVLGEYGYSRQWKRAWGNAVELDPTNSTSSPSAEEDAARVATTG